MGRVTTETSKGFAGLIATLVALAGMIEAAYPGMIPLAGAIVRNAPIIGDHGPAMLAALGAIYAAASSPIPWLRHLLPWKKIRTRG